VVLVYLALQNKQRIFFSIKMNASNVLAKGCVDSLTTNINYSGTQKSAYLRQGRWFGIIVTIKQNIRYDIPSVAGMTGPHLQAQCSGVSCVVRPPPNPVHCSPPFVRQCWGLPHRLAQCMSPQGWGKLVNAALLSLINEACVNVCCATLLSSEVNSSAPLACRHDRLTRGTVWYSRV